MFLNLLYFIWRWIIILKQKLFGIWVASNSIVSVTRLLTEMTMLLSNGMTHCFDLIIQILIGVYEANVTSKSLCSHCVLLPDQSDRYICGKHGKSASINATSLRIKDQTLLERTYKQNVEDWKKSEIHCCFYNLKLKKQTKKLIYFYFKNTISQEMKLTLYSLINMRQLQILFR